MAKRFDEKTLDQLRQKDEVRVETSRGDAVHRTIIWVVVDGDDVFIRSVRGPRGRWYRELSDSGKGALIIGRTRIPIRALPADDDESIERASRALREKYRSSGASLRSMLRPETLPTTLRVEPAS
jgi:hypothetical protein